MFIVDTIIELANELERKGFTTEARLLHSAVEEVSVDKDSKVDIDVNNVPSKQKEPKVKQEEEWEKIKRQKLIELFLGLEEKYRNLLNNESKYVAFVGEDNMNPLKHAFDVVIATWKKVRAKKGSLEDDLQKQAAVKATDTVNFVYRFLKPIQNAYQRFLRLTEGDDKYTGVGTAFNNLDNVINNIIQNVPEEITGLDMTRK